MDMQQIHAAALAQRVTPQALDHVTAKVQAHFGERTPPPAELAAYIASVYVWEKLGMTQAEFYAMPAAWRLEQGEAYRQPVDRRATDRMWTAEELKALQGKSVIEQLTAGHRGPPEA